MRSRCGPDPIWPFVDLSISVPPWVSIDQEAGRKSSRGNLLVSSWRWAGLKEVTLWSPRCRWPLSSLGARAVIGVLGGNCAMMACCDGRDVLTDLFVGREMGMPVVLIRWKREISRFSEIGRKMKGGGGKGEGGGMAESR